MAPGSAVSADRQETPVSSVQTAEKRCLEFYRISFGAMKSQIGLC